MANMICFIVLKLNCFDNTIKGSCCPVLTQPREHYGHFHSAASCLCISSRWDVEKPWRAPALEWKDTVVFHLRGNLFFCNEKKTLEIWPFYAARPWWKQLISLKPKVPQMSSNHNMNHVTQAMSKWKRVRVYRKTGQTLLYKSWLWDTNWYEKKSHNYNISQNYEILKHNKSQNDEIIKS